MNTFKRLLQTTVHRIWRSPHQALGAIFVMLLTFFVGNIIVVITLASQTTLAYFETQPNVIAFLRDEATDNQVEELKSLLISTGAVKEIKYVSKEEALRDFQSSPEVRDKPILQENVTAAILPASLRVSATDLSKLDVFKDILSKEKIVESVSYQPDVVKKLGYWSNIIRTYGGGIILFLLFTSTIITLVVISLNISTYKDEIEIMRLVGATSWYIRIPFILEGIFYGVVAAVVSTLIFSLLVVYFTPALKSFFQNIPAFPLPISTYFILLGGELLIGVAIGTIAALTATRKYLKV